MSKVINTFIMNIQFERGLTFTVSKQSHQFNYDVSCGVGEIGLVNNPMNDEKTSDILDWLLGPIGPTLLSQYGQDDVVIEVFVGEEKTSITIHREEMEKS